MEHLFSGIRMKFIEMENQNAAHAKEIKTFKLMRTAVFKITYMVENVEIC